MIPLAARTEVDWISLSVLILLFASGLSLVLPAVSEAVAAAVETVKTFPDT